MNPTAFENLDHVVTTEMRPQGLPMGIVPKLYAVARRNGPICSEAAVALLGAGRVLVLTGIATPDMLPRGEVDGPIGAGVLALVLERLGLEADVAVPEEMLGVMNATRDALGGGFGVLGQMPDPAAYAAAATVEKLGHNRKGVYHSIFGTPLVEQDAEGDEFVEAMNAAGKPTVGIGDGGNEIGFGAMFDPARELVPRGADCGCPCEDGIVTSTGTSIVFPAAVSNFGAYAIAAAAAILRDAPESFPSADDVAGAMAAAVDEGCLDGGTFQPGLVADDGIPLDGVKAVVTLLGTIVHQHFRRTERHV